MTVRVLCLFLRVPWVCLQCVIMVVPGHTHLRFGHFIYRSALCYLLSDNSLLAVNSVNYFTILVAIADLFLVVYVGFAQSMASHPQADVQNLCISPTCFI